MAKEKKALKSLGENTEIVIRQADKEGGIVVQNYGDYNAEALNIQSNTVYYKKIEKDPFPRIFKL